MVEGNRSTHATQDEIPRRAARSRIQMVFDSGRPIAHVAKGLGIHHERLRKSVRRTGGRRKDPLTSQEREELKALRSEVRELRRANEILKSASAFSRLSHTGKIQTGSFRSSDVLRVFNWLARSDRGVVSRSAARSG